jgi:hypothetical protein
MIHTSLLVPEGPVCNLNLLSGCVLYFAINFVFVLRMVSKINGCTIV